MEPVRRNQMASPMTTSAKVHSGVFSRVRTNRIRFRETTKGIRRCKEFMIRLRSARPRCITLWARTIHTTPAARSANASSRSESPSIPDGIIRGAVRTYSVGPASFCFPSWGDDAQPKGGMGRGHSMPTAGQGAGGYVSPSACFPAARICPPCRLTGAFRRPGLFQVSR